VSPLALIYICTSIVFLALLIILFNKGFDSSDIKVPNDLTINIQLIGKIVRKMVWHNFRCRSDIFLGYVKIILQKPTSVNCTVFNSFTGIKALLSRAIVI
jgi:hypothetical protein